MKLKLDENGHVVVVDGKPVYTHDDGKDAPYDVPDMYAKILRDGKTNVDLRAELTASAAKLKVFEGIDDVEAAKKAIETVKNIDQGTLVAAGKVEEIKAAAKKAAEEQVAAAQKAHQDKVAELEATNAKLSATLNSELIGGAFTRSKFIQEKIAIPSDMIQSRFGENFKLEEGKVVGYDSAGQKIFSRARPGEVADFEEAIESLVEKYPQKEHILKGSGNSGDGKRQNSNSNTNGAKVLPRAEYDRLTVSDPVAVATKMREGYTIQD